MAFDGAGTFLRLYSWVVDATNSVKIRADRHDDEDNNFAAGLSNCITKDGQTAITQNIPFNSRRIISLADPIDPQDAATKDYADTKASLAGGATFTGDMVLKEDTPSITLDGKAGFKNSIVGQKTDKNRWEIVLGNATAESGADVGSDFQLVNYHDDGTLIGDVLFGSRATGLLTAKGNPTAALGIATKQYVDTGVNAATAAANTKLPLAGGTVTGNLTIGGYASVGQNILYFNPLGGAGYLQWQGGSLYTLGGAGNIWHSGNFNPLSMGGNVVFTGNVTTNGDFHLGGNFYPAGSTGAPWGDAWHQDGNLVVTTQGYKPGGGSWGVPSDERIKTVHGDYTRGLAAVRQLQPVRYEYKGNIAAHKNVLGREFVGLVAQHAERLMPEMVTQIADRIDGQEVPDLRVLDNSALVYALVNAVKELATRIETLEAGR